MKVLIGSGNDGTAVLLRLFNKLLAAAKLGKALGGLPNIHWFNQQFVD
jgi:hypothetical protein